MGVTSTKVALALCLVVGSSMGARQLRGNKDRESRNLLGTFPFNAQEGESHGAHGEHHGDHHGDHQAAHEPNPLTSRAERQGDDVAVDFGAVAAAGPGADGKRCIDKVEMVEETEYDDVVQCDHSYDRRCHTTYVTNYESSRRRSARRTSGRTVSSSTNRSPSTRQLVFAELLWSRTVMSKVLRSAGLSTSPSVGPSRRFMMSRTMLWIVRLRLRRSVRTRPPATPPTPSAPSGPRRCALYPRRV